jgi:hypothetical protein
MTPAERERRRQAKMFNERLKAGASAANGAALAMIAAALLAPINLADGIIKATEIPVRAGLIVLSLVSYYIGFLILGLYQSED